MVKDTYKLINTINKLYPVQQFFKDRYFPDGAVYYSQHALIETKKQGRKAAPFVIPVVNGIAVKAEGYRSFEVDAPFIAPKMAITAQELELKRFGESPESGRTPAQRENEVEAEHLDDLRNSILRRHEQMCTEVITTGKLSMKHYASAEDAAKDQNAQIRELQFFEDEDGFVNRYTFSSDFKTMSAQDKILEFYKIANILHERGVGATDIVMTGDVSMLLMSDVNFLEFFNKQRVEIGNVKPEVLPPGVVNNGVLNVRGIMFTLYTYDAQYVDIDGKVKPLLPAGTIAFLQPGMGTTVYAQVTLVEGGGFKSYAQKIVARLLADEDNNLVEVQTFSRPIPYPLDWEGWIVANINTSGNGSSNLWTVEQINAATTKAAIIEYAESIGLTTLSTSSSLSDLKAAVIAYQNSL